MSRRNTSLSLKGRGAGGSMAVTARGASPQRAGPSGANGNVVSCSTPDPHRQPESTSCDSDSEAASPVPFLCTQDGSYGDIDVVWNHYASPRVRHATPLSRRSKKIVKSKHKIVEKLPPRKRPPRETQKKTQLFQDLFELNENIQGLLAEKKNPENDFAEIQNRSGSEDDIFNSSNSSDRSPKTDGFLKSNSKCLRKNLLSSKFSKPEPETALESDDSMNECLMKASQMIEERIFSSPTTSKRCGSGQNNRLSVKKFKYEQDSMDSILNNIKLTTVKKELPNLNDSFDSFVGNLNDSALEKLTQLPIKNESQICINSNGHSNNSIIKNKRTKAEECGSPKGVYTSGWTIKELIAIDSVPSPKSAFGRHNSMPESPSVCRNMKPSTSGTVFSRYNSMPWGRDGDEEQAGNSNTDDSPPLRCTPDEIKRKHQLAREKLLAKKLFPFTSTQQTQEPTKTDVPTSRNRNVPKFQPKFPSKISLLAKNITEHNTEMKKTQSLPCLQRNVERKTDMATESGSQVDLKSIIEKKRKEALLKLKKKRSQNNIQ